MQRTVSPASAVARLRAALLLGAVAAVGLATAALVRPWWDLLIGPGPTEPGLAPALTGGCAVVLAGCWLWWAAGVAATCCQQLLPGARSWRLDWVPAGTRVLVTATVGTALGVAPASAEQPATPVPSVVGLQVPDRVSTVPAGPRTVRVRPGDSLWSIAADQLPAHADDAAVDAGWRRLARANRDRLADPDLIVPGTVLRVPRLAPSPRKEPS